jgi:uncharacterized membrane protein YjjP (DUF1212 family)
MRAEQLRMGAEIARLRAQVERLATALGVDLGDEPAAGG